MSVNIYRNSKEPTVNMPDDLEGGVRHAIYCLVFHMWLLQELLLVNMEVKFHI